MQAIRRRATRLEGEVGMMDIYGYYYSPGYFDKIFASFLLNFNKTLITTKFSSD
jgi:hypothetical protein